MKMRNCKYFWGLLSLVALILCYQNVNVDNSTYKNKDSMLEKYVSEKLKQDTESNPEKSWANGILWESISKNKSHASFSAKVNKNVPEFNIQLLYLKMQFLMRGVVPTMV
jgi:hypothetical protein